MKKYKVLEAHQGDRFYQPGDGETGTRIADPNAVGHLVTLGLLEEIGDVAAAAPAAIEAGSVAVLQAQIAALTQERDSALVDLAALGSTHQAAQNAASTVRDQFEAVMTERDGLREQVTAATSERDGLREQLIAAISERDGLTAQLATVTSERDAHSARVTALEGEIAAQAAATQRPARNR